MQMVNTIAIIRDGHAYFFLFHDHQVPDILRTLGRWASDPELEFSWYEAAVASKEIRKVTHEHRKSVESVCQKRKTNGRTRI